MMLRKGRSLAERLPPPPIPRRPRDGFSKPLPSLERLQMLLAYDAASGELRWRVPRGGGIKAGTVIRRSLLIDGQRYLASRICWKLHAGRDPIGVIDHRNRDKSDNRARNLRDVSHSFNSQNVGMHPGNTSGHRGVDRRGGRWRARICVDRRVIELGTYATIEEAARAYIDASAIYHPATWL